MINATQKKLIHIAKAQLKLSDADYRALLVQFSPTSWDMPADKPSCVHMTYEEASNLIKHFKTLGFKIMAKRTPSRRGTINHAPTNITSLPSPQQLAKIQHLRADVRWFVPEGYHLWMRKFLKKDRITTSKEASNIIQALRGMLARQEGKGRKKG